MAQRVNVQRIFVVMAMCLMFTAPSWAQDYLKHVTVGAGAGFSFPVGEAGDHTKTGFNFVATGGPRFNRHLVMTVDFSLHYLDIKNSFHSPDSDVDLSLGSIMRLWSLTVNPGYEFLTRENFSAYATGGYGLYNRKLLLAGQGPVVIFACDQFFDVCVDRNPLANSTVSGNVNPYKGGYNVGGGVMFGTRTKFFIESRYHHMFTDKPTELIPITVGIRW